VNRYRRVRRLTSLDEDSEEGVQFAAPEREAGIAVDPRVEAATDEALAALPAEDRFAARLKLAEMPRNSSPTRFRLRCELSGRPRGVYRKFKLSRIALRDLASAGQIPGMVKSSW